MQHGKLSRAICRPALSEIVFRLTICPALALLFKRLPKKEHQMQYPLEEKIGVPELLVKRKREEANFGKWLSWIPKKLAKSRVILARRKSGKTAFVQRIFNQLWNENGTVIPFYFDVADVKTSLFELSVKYYCAFASQYISFLERDASLVDYPLSLQEIGEYGQAKSNTNLTRDVTVLLDYQKHRNYGLMWDTAYSAPNRYASNTELRFLVILDEFQNLSAYIYRNEECKGEPDDSIPGSYHNFSESKVAPILVTGSYVSWLIKIAAKYLQASRLAEWYMDPYLTPEEGLEAVYRYAEVIMCRSPMTQHFRSTGFACPTRFLSPV